MKTRLHTKKIFFAVLVIFILSCGPTLPTLLTPADQNANPDSHEGETQTATLPPTVALTATVYPPVWDPEAIGDNRVLDSFVLTRTDKTTGSGEVDEQHYTIGYIKEPFNGYKIYGFLADKHPFKTYFIDGWSYRTTGSEDYIISQGYVQEDLDYFLQYDADMREGQLFAKYFVESAQFIGQEDFAGIPANHFTFDQTNLGEHSDPTGTYKIESAIGDIYLAQGANYLVRFNIKLTGNVYSPGGSPDYFPGVREVTEELSSINQLTEIAVPDEYIEAEQTLLDLGIPLPAGTTLTGLRRFAGSAVESSFYAASVNNEEFFEFYKNLTPTDGWTVSHIGMVLYHRPCDSQVCVIINKGGAQVILYYGNGGFGADYDREHQFSPK